MHLFLVSMDWSIINYREVFQRISPAEEERKIICWKVGSLPEIIKIFVFRRLPLCLSLFQEFSKFLNGILQLEGVVTVVLHNPLVEVLHLGLLRLVDLRQLGAADTVLLGEGSLWLVLLQEPTGGTERPGQSTLDLVFLKNNFNVIFL